jgi:predicted HAD superfamily hydrolase
MPYSFKFVKNRNSSKSWMVSWLEKGNSVTEIDGSVIHVYNLLSSQRIYLRRVVKTIFSLFLVHLTDSYTT